MAHEIIFTSVQQGLDAKRHGFCAVAKSRGIPAGLERTLEEISAYHHAFPPDSPEAPQNPVTFSFTLFRQLGTVYYVLTRICDAGVDYSLHSNRLAHHIVLEESELNREGPAWLLMQPNFQLKEWVGPALQFERCRGIPTFTGPQRAGKVSHLPTDDWYHHFQLQRGSQILQTAMTQYRPVVIFFSPGMSLLPLLAEVASHLGEKDRWAIPFSTYYHTHQHFETPPPCLIQCVLKGSNEERLRIPPDGELVIDLTATVMIHDRSADGSNNDENFDTGIVSGTHSTISELAPPSTHSSAHSVSDIALSEKTGIAPFWNRALRTKSRLLFYSIYGVTAILCLLLIYLLLTPLSRPQVTTDPDDPDKNVPHHAGGGGDKPKPKPVPPKPELSDEEKAKLRQEQFLAAVIKQKDNFKKLVPEQSDKLPKSFDLNIPKPDAKPQNFAALAPFYDAAHLLQLEFHSLTQIPNWTFRTDKEEYDLLDETHTAFRWEIFGCDEKSRHEKLLLTATLDKKGLLLEWSEAALTNEYAYEASLLALGELRLQKWNDADDKLETFATIPLWNTARTARDRLSLLATMNAESGEISLPLFFHNTPWKEIFARFELTSALVLEVAPLTSSAIGDDDDNKKPVRKIEVVPLDVQRTQINFTTEVYDEKKLNPTVVSFEVSLVDGAIVLTDAAKNLLEKSKAEIAQLNSELAKLDTKIKELRRLNFIITNPEEQAKNREKIDELAEEQKALQASVTLKEDIIDKLPEAQKRVRELLEQEKLAIDFSLFFVSGEEKILLQSTR